MRAAGVASRTLLTAGLRCSPGEITFPARINALAGPAQKSFEARAALMDICRLLPVEAATGSLIDLLFRAAHMWSWGTVDKLALAYRLVRTIHELHRARLVTAGSGLGIREGSGIRIAGPSQWPLGTRVAGISLVVLLRSSSRRRTQPGASQARVIDHTTRPSGRRFRDRHRAGGRLRAGKAVRI